MKRTVIARSRLLALFSLVTMGLLSAWVAYAANVHFKGNTAPTFTDLGTRLQTQACLAGLGNQDVRITVTAQGSATTTCTNKGGNTAEGINKKLVSVAGTQTISRTEVKNGNVCFNVVTSAPPNPTAKEAGCPNNNWTATINDVVFTQATITVVQGGKTVLTQTFKL